MDRTSIRVTHIAMRGFSLVELAVVLMIVGLLLGGLLVPLSAQRDTEALKTTEKALLDIREALLGFAAASGRLPCPASATSNGLESFCTTASGGCTASTLATYASHGRCSDPYGGFLPAATLGLSPVDSQGYYVDAWPNGTSSRVRYAVTTANTNAFTQTQGMKTITMTTLAPDLKVCASGSVVTGTSTCSAYLAAEAVAVVYSLGRNGGTGGTSDDEKHNPNVTSGGAGYVAPDQVFVNATPGANFDDQMTWLSKNTLYSRMLTANQLP